MNRYQWDGVTAAVAESRMEGEAVKRVPDLAGEDQAAFPNALLAELAAGTPLVGNVLSYGADPTGAVDSTTAFQACIDANRSVYVPPGRYLLRQVTQHWPPWANPSTDPSHYVGVVVPANREIFGAGDESVILTHLDPQYLPLENGDQTGDTPWEPSWFWVDWHADNVSFHDLKFEGDGPAPVTSTNFILNLQGCVIEMAYGSNDAADPTHRPPNSVRIERCTFEKQWAFTAHQRGGDAHGYRFSHNRSVDCMNGPNLNCDHMRCDHNLFIRSEGFENGGTAVTYIGNDFQDCFGCISAGGDQTGSDGSDGQPVAPSRPGWHFGQIMIGNTIRGGQYIAGVYEPQAISVADNLHDVVVTDNVFERVRTMAINVHGDNSVRLPSRVQIRNNMFIACVTSIYVPSADDVVIEGNLITDRTADGELIYEGETGTNAIIIGAATRNARVGVNSIRLSSPTRVDVASGASSVSFATLPWRFEVTPSDAGTIGVDADRYGYVFWRMTGTHARTVLEPTNAGIGQEVTLELVNANDQAAEVISGFTFNGPNWVLDGSLGPLDPGGFRTILVVKFDGSKWVERYRNQNFGGYTPAS